MLTSSCHSAFPLSVFFLVCSFPLCYLCSFICFLSVHLLYVFCCLSSIINLSFVLCFLHVCLYVCRFYVVYLFFCLNILFLLFLSSCCLWYVLFAVIYLQSYILFGLFSLICPEFLVWQPVCLIFYCLYFIMCLVPFFFCRLLSIRYPIYVCLPVCLWSASHLSLEFSLYPTACLPSVCVLWSSLICWQMFSEFHLSSIFCRMSFRFQSLCCLLVYPYHLYRLLSFVYFLSIWLFICVSSSVIHR